MVDKVSTSLRWYAVRDAVREGPYGRGATVGDVREFVMLFSRICK